MLATRMYEADKAAEILKRFPVDAKNPAYMRARELYEKGNFTAGMTVVADAYAKAGLDVYGYYFNYVTESSKARNVGAAHGSELDLVFGLLPDTSEDKEMQRQMHTRWVNFIKSGNPNGAQLLSWPKYNKSFKQMLTFAPYLKISEMPEKNDILFFRDLAFGNGLPE